MQLRCSSQQSKENSLHSGYSGLPILLNRETFGYENLDVAIIEPSVGGGQVSTTVTRKVSAAAITGLGLRRVGEQLQSPIESIVWHSYSSNPTARLLQT
jgi:hypothetical protein